MAEPPHGRLRGDPAAPASEPPALAPPRVPALACRHRRADAAAEQQARGARVLHRPHVRIDVRHRRRRPRRRSVQAGVGSPRRPQRQDEARRRDHGRHVQRARVPVRQHQARRRHLAAQPGHPRDAARPAAAHLPPRRRALERLRQRQGVQLRVPPRDGAVQGTAPPVPRRRHGRLHRAAGVHAGGPLPLLLAGVARRPRLLPRRRDRHVQRRRRPRHRRRRHVLGHQGRREGRVVRPRGRARRVRRAAARGGRAWLRPPPHGGPREPGARRLRRQMAGADQDRRLGSRPACAGVEPAVQRAGAGGGVPAARGPALRARRVRAHRERAGKQPEAPPVRAQDARRRRGGEVAERRGEVLADQGRGNGGGLPQGRLLLPSDLRLRPDNGAAERVQKEATNYQAVFLIST